jgi:AraC-like DNA-binding protein
MVAIFVYYPRFTDWLFRLYPLLVAEHGVAFDRSVCYYFYPYLLPVLSLFFTSQDKKLPWWAYLFFCIPVAQFLFSGYVYYIYYTLSEIKANFYAILDKDIDSHFHLALVANEIILWSVIGGLALALFLSVFFRLEIKAVSGKKNWKKMQRVERRFPVLLSISFALILLTIVHVLKPGCHALVDCIYGTGIFCSGFLMSRSLTRKPVKQKYPVYRLIGPSLLAVKLLQYFEQAQPWRNPSLSEEMVIHEIGTNREYLSHLLNGEFGISFNDFVNEHRIDEAIRLMHALGLGANLNDIAEQSGFNCYGTFYNAFVKKMGMAPKKFLGK